MLGVRWLVVTALATAVSIVLIVSPAVADPEHVEGRADFVYDALFDDVLSRGSHEPAGIALTASEEKAASAAEILSGYIYDSSVSFVAPSGAVDDVVGTANRFSIHDRVAGQLNDPRLGNLQGRFGTDDLQALTTSPNATAYLDVRSGHINVIQEIDGVLLRIMTAADEFRIISVGRVRPAQLTNGSIIPIGSGG